jgi:hypothetical protein
LCGFIVYSRKNPHVSQLLRDIDYWMELDAISGVNWPIFAVRPVAQRHPYTRSAARIDEVDEESVRMCLDLEDEELPCFVCFMWDDKGNLRKISHKIDDRSIETTHTDLRELVTRVSRVITDIHEEYMQSENVFRNVKEEVESYNAQTRFKSIVKGTVWMIDMFNRLPQGRG